MLLVVALSGSSGGAPLTPSTPRGRTRHSDATQTATAAAVAAPLRHAQRVTRSVVFALQACLKGSDRISKASTHEHRVHAIALAILPFKGGKKQL